MIDVVADAERREDDAFEPAQEHVEASAHFRPDGVLLDRAVGGEDVADLRVARPDAGLGEAHELHAVAGERGSPALLGISYVGGCRLVGLPAAADDVSASAKR